MNRVKNAMRHVANSPKYLVYTLVGNWVFASMLYALIESKGPITSLWWGIVTGSTVGYGDFYPASTAGRGVGAYLIVTSIALVAIGTAQLSARLILDPDMNEVLDDTDDTILLLCLIAEKLEIPIPDSIEEYYNKEGTTNGDHSSDA